MRKKTKSTLLFIFIVVMMALVIFMNTDTGRAVIGKALFAIEDALGLHTESIVITPDELMIENSVYPTTVEIRAYAEKENGRTSDDIRWRFLSSDGEEGPDGIMPLASKGYGEMTACITKPGVYVVEASDSEMAETMLITAKG